MLGAELEATTARGNEAPLPACAHLDRAVSTVRERGGVLADLADAIALIADRSVWVRRHGPEPSTPAFARGHANAVLARASTPDAVALLGISLMAPYVRYPDHHHPPEEVYVVLSRGEWWNDRTDWLEPGIGGIVHNPAGIVHAMRSGAAPLLAIWLHHDAHLAR